MENILHVGLDVGSTTVKIVVMDENLNTIYNDYTRRIRTSKNGFLGVKNTYSYTRYKRFGKAE